MWAWHSKVDVGGCELEGAEFKAGLWLYASVVDWMLKCGRGT